MICGDYGYIVNRDREKAMYLRCRRTYACKGRALVDKATCKLVVKHEHSCGGSVDP